MMPVASVQTDSGIVLMARDRRVIEHVWRFRLLSRDQLMVLGPFQSVTRANTRLARLVRARLLSRKTLPVYPGQGGAQALYAVGSATARALGKDPVEGLRQARQAARWDAQHTAHLLAANQVLIEFLALTNRSSDPKVLNFQTEAELRRQFLDRRLVPDGWIAWAHNGRRFNCFIEVDLHHEGLREWRKKVLDYLAYGESGFHQELFHFQACRVLVLTRSRPRLDHIRRLAEPAGRMFLFATLADIRSSPVFGPVWLTAAGPTRIALDQA